MPRFQFPPLAILAACLTCAPAFAEAAEPIVIPGFSNPESVLIGPETRYVSNIGAKLDPLAHDGDGFVSLLDARGQVLEPRAFTGLDAPKGMALSGGRLYVADIDRVVGFDLATRRRVSSATLPGAAPSLLNDIAVMGDRLLVTDTLRGELFAFDPGMGQFVSLAADIPGANGIVWDADRERAVIVALGADFAGGDLFTWAAATGPRRVPDSPRGIFDGVALLPDGRVLVSDWVSPTASPGTFLIVDPDTGDSVTRKFGAEIHGPADFARDADGALWVPAMIDGVVLVLPPPA